MLFFGVFLRETACPVAKSRNNLAQIQIGQQSQCRGTEGTGCANSNPQPELGIRYHGQYGDN